MPVKCRVIIAEDQTMVRQLLSRIVSADKDFDLLDEAKDGIEAVQKVQSLKPDLVLIDAFMPGMNALDVFRDIRAKMPKVKFLVISAHENTQLVRQVLELGIHGFIEKSAPIDELLRGIKKVAAGDVYFGPAIQRLVKQIAAEKFEKMDFLTTREKEIVKMIAESKTTKEIAYDLGISVKTVENHRTNLMGKLKLRDIAAVTRYAIQQGMVAVDRVS